MRKLNILCSIVCISVLGFTLSSFQHEENIDPLLHDTVALRKAYSTTPDLWPKPFVDSNINHKELGVMPPSIAIEKADSLQYMIKLGRLLFHDPRLSQSNQISCSSCHVPGLNWTDGKSFAKGHDHNIVPRNTPTIENISLNTSYFWGGKAQTLEAQAPHSLTNPLEMNMDVTKLPKKLSKIKGYSPFFQNAFGDKKVTLDRITAAITMYERSIVAEKLISINLWKETITS